MANPLYLRGTNIQERLHSLDMDSDCTDDCSFGILLIPMDDPADYSHYEALSMEYKNYIDTILSIITHIYETIEGKQSFDNTLIRTVKTEVKHKCTMESVKYSIDRTVALVSNEEAESYFTSLFQRVSAIIEILTITTEGFQSGYALTSASCDIFTVMEKVQFLFGINRHILPLISHLLLSLEDPVVSEGTAFPFSYGKQYVFGKLNSTLFESSKRAVLKLFSLANTVGQEEGWLETQTCRSVSNLLLELSNIVIYPADIDILAREALERLSPRLPQSLSQMISQFVISEVKRHSDYVQDQRSGRKEKYASLEKDALILESIVDLPCTYCSAIEICSDGSDAYKNCKILNARLGVEGDWLWHFDRRLEDIPSFALRPADIISIPAIAEREIVKPARPEPSTRRPIRAIQGMFARMSP